jgi:hypothetical protein
LRVQAANGLRCFLLMQIHLPHIRLWLAQAVEVELGVVRMADLAVTSLLSLWVKTRMQPVGMVVLPPVEVRMDLVWVALEVAVLEQVQAAWEQRQVCLLRH